MTFIAREVLSAPTVVTPVNDDDTPVTLAYGVIYEVNNDGAVPADDIDLNLPAIASGDRGKPIFVKCRYNNNPMNPASFGHGILKRAGSNVILLLGASVTTIDLLVNDENLVLRHDGVNTWYLG